jgi:DNA-binding FadR family transcriptional regulator
VNLDEAARNYDGLFEPVPVRRLREQVEEQIRAAILSGQLSIGSRLPSEQVLAKEFSVSRTTVREALRSLASKGLLTKMAGSGGGSFVRSVDHWSLGHMMREGIENLLQLGTIETGEASSVRKILEVPAVRLAALHATEVDLRVLDRVIEQLATSSVNDPGIPALDVQFHTTIALASGNRVLACLVFALHRASEPVRQLGLTAEVGRVTHRQHLRIVDAIRRGEPDAAEKAMIDHLAYLEEHPKRDPAGRSADRAPVG